MRRKPGEGPARRARGAREARGVRPSIRSSPPIGPAWGRRLPRGRKRGGSPARPRGGKKKATSIQGKALAGARAARAAPGGAAPEPVALLQPRGGGRPRAAPASLGCDSDRPRGLAGAGRPALRAAARSRPGLRPLGTPPRSARLAGDDQIDGAAHRPRSPSWACSAWACS